MNTKRTWIIIVLLIICAVLYVGTKEYQKEPDVMSDYKNATYMINGQSVKLLDGLSETETAPGSASKIVTRYFGNELKTDLNNDGREDLAFILTQETGGSGTSFYAVAALNTEQGYVGSDGYFLGDRIAPQSTTVSQNAQHKNVVVFNYADRKPNEPMSASPTVAKSVYLKLDPSTMQWGIVEPSFEGEVNPSRMTLNMKRWDWVNALYNDGRILTPKTLASSTKIFSLYLSNNGTFTGSTDCNAIGGSYLAKDGQMTFGDIYTTERYCEGSQEKEFIQLLQNTIGYHFTGRGHLIFDLKFDSGTATFR